MDAHSPERDRQLTKPVGGAAEGSTPPRGQIHDKGDFLRRRFRTRPTVIGTGLLALDIVVSELSGSALEQWAGGTCGNVLAILSYLGWRAYPVARLNGDEAAERVRLDLGRWGVRLDFASGHRGHSTPIVVQRILADSQGAPRHVFSSNCPRCGAWLPRYRSILASDAREVAKDLAEMKPQVFFLDRVSPGALLLARASADEGAVVVLEPSNIGDPGLFAQAVSLAHIVKYSHERLTELPLLPSSCIPLLEVKTLGARGLRFRTRLGSKDGQLGDWQTLSAFQIERLADAAGSGDWCTAGLVHALCTHGLAGLLACPEDQVRAALRFGQALAAWNCGFEGARGGMYRASRRQFRESIGRILVGNSTQPAGRRHKAAEPLQQPDTFCASCQRNRSGQSAQREQTSTVPAQGGSRC